MCAGVHRGADGVHPGDGGQHVQAAPRGAAQPLQDLRHCPYRHPRPRVPLHSHQVCLASFLSRLV